jgi:hypothetical protein
VTLPATISPADFMASAAYGPAGPSNGSSPWAVRYAGELRQVVIEHAANAPRSLQTRLGPSELGHQCDRQVIGKMAGVPRTNHVTDPWPSVMGTAGHAWMDGAFTADNSRHGHRWEPERKVQPWPGAEGTSDLYDHKQFAVVDHKFLGDSTLGDLRRHGPPWHYYVQLLLYGLGYRREGFRVDRVVIVAWPRTKSSLAGMYVWDHPLTDADDAILVQVYQLTQVRRRVAELVASGQLTINQVPATPDDDSCYFCPFYRPQSAHDGGPGCPGNRAP